jgi:hypothetical protein
VYLNIAQRHRRKMYCYERCHPLDDTELNTLAATANGGDIRLVERDALGIVFVRNTTATGAFALRAGGQITVLAARGGIATNNGAAEIVSTGAGIFFDDALSTTGGKVALTAAQTIEQSAAGRIRTGGGRFLALAGGSYIQQNGSLTDAGSGEIALTAANDVLLANFTTTNNTAAAVAITATNGAILDSGDAAPDITAYSPAAVVTLTAATGIGTGAFGALETQIAKLAAVVTAAGDIDLDNDRSLQILSSATTSGAQHYATEGGLRVEKLDVDTAGTGAAHDAALLARAGDLVLGELVSANGGDFYLTASDSILSRASGSVLKTGSGTMSFTTKKGGIENEDGGTFAASINGILDMLIKGNVRIRQTLEGGDLTFGTLAADGSVLLESPGVIVARRITTNGDLDLVANGSLIDVGIIGFGGAGDSMSHPMDTRHLVFMLTIAPDFNPDVQPDGVNAATGQAAGNINLRVNTVGGVANIGDMYVRDTVNVFADNSLVEQVHVQSADGTLEVNLSAPQSGGRAKTADWTFGASSVVNFGTYWTERGTLTAPETSALRFADAWTVRSDIWNSRTYVIAESLLKTLQGGDVQIYSLDERFTLDMIGRNTYTDAFYINYRDQRLVERLFGDENSLVRLSRKENAQWLRFDAAPEESWAARRRHAAQLDAWDTSVGETDSADAGTSSIISWKTATYQLHPVEQ